MVLGTTGEGQSPADEGLNLEPLDATHAAETRTRKPISTRKPRGTGSRNKKVDRKQFTQQVVGVHNLLAVLTKEPMLAITTEEGDALASACADIIEEYGLAMSRRALLWGNLVGAVAIVYGPKVLYGIDQASKRRAATKKPPTMPAGGPMATPNVGTLDFSAL